MGPACLLATHLVEQAWWSSLPATTILLSLYYAKVYDNISLFMHMNNIQHCHTGFVSWWVLFIAFLCAFCVCVCVCNVCVCAL